MSSNLSLIEDTLSPASRGVVAKVISRKRAFGGIFLGFPYRELVTIQGLSIVSSRAPAQHRLNSLTLDTAMYLVFVRCTTTYS